MNWISRKTELKMEINHYKQSLIEGMDWTPNKDHIDFLETFMPDHYDIIDCNPKLAIRCKSNIGLRHRKDSDDNEHWEYVEKAIKQHFGDKLSDIAFNTHAYFQDFTIYYKS